MYYYSACAWLNSLLQFYYEYLAQVKNRRKSWIINRLITGGLSKRFSALS